MSLHGVKKNAPIRAEPLDPNDVPARIEELKLLRNGWLDGKGLAPDAAGLQWLATIWGRPFPHDLPNPYIYPTPEGGVQLEWTLGTWELSAELDLKTHMAELFAQDIGSGACVEEQANLSTPEGWAALSRFVQSKLPSTAVHA